MTNSTGQSDKAMTNVVATVPQTTNEQPIKPQLNDISEMKSCLTVIPDCIKSTLALIYNSSPRTKVSLGCGCICSFFSAAVGCVCCGTSGLAAAGAGVPAAGGCYYVSRICEGKKMDNCTGFEEKKDNLLDPSPTMTRCTYGT